MIADERLVALKTIATSPALRTGSEMPILRAGVIELVDEVIQLRREKADLTQQVAIAKYGDR